MLNILSTSTSFEEPRRSKRGWIIKDYVDDFLIYLAKGEPSSYAEVMSSSDAPFWKEAVDGEIKSILENNSLHITNLPQGFKTIGCRWIFFLKIKA